MPGTELAEHSLLRDSRGRNKAEESPEKNHRDPSMPSVSEGKREEREHCAQSPEWFPANTLLCHPLLLLGPLHLSLSLPPRQTSSSPLSNPRGPQTSVPAKLAGFPRLHILNPQPLHFIPSTWNALSSRSAFDGEEEGGAGGKGSGMMLPHLLTPLPCIPHTASLTSPLPAWGTRQR